MILDVHGKMSRSRLERQPLRDGPARENAVALETEVVMQPPCGVTLNDEDRRPPSAARLRGTCLERLARSCRIALSPVGRQLLCRLFTHASRFPNTSGDNPVDPVDTPKRGCRQAREISRVLRGHGRRKHAHSAEFRTALASSLLGIEVDDLRQRLADRSASNTAAASGSFWAPPGGSGTIASTTPSSRQ